MTHWFEEEEFREEVLRRTRLGGNRWEKVVAEFRRPEVSCGDIYWA